MAIEDEPSERQLTEDELFETLTNEAQFVAGDTRIFSDRDEIPWLDMDLAQSGQDFFQEHYTSMLLAHVLYFGIGFGFKPVTGVIIKMGEFTSIDRVTKRLLSTIWHLLSWYEQDILGTYSVGTKAIANTRKTHEMMRRKCGRESTDTGTDFDFGIDEPDPVGEALKKDLDFVDMSTFEQMDLTYDPPVPMSQFSMAGTQLSFVIPCIGQPEAFGIYDNKGWEGFEHLWALIGHLSGVEDRYNVPLQRPGKSFYVRFLIKVVLPSLLIRDSKIVQVQQSFFRSSNTSMFSLSIPGTLYFFLSQSKVEGFKGEELYKLMSLGDKAAVFFFRILLLLFRFSTIRKVVNWFVKRMMSKVLTKFAKEEEAAGRQFTYLPNDTRWSAKYRRQDQDVLYKWKLGTAKLGFVNPNILKERKKAQYKK